MGHMSEENLCVLIDFENIAAGTEREGLGKFNIRIVLDRLKEKGRLLATRAYGDWGRYAKFKQRFLEHGVSMMELTSYRGQDKNRADIALVVDAMEMAFTREHIGTYVLLSGDSDFTPLVMRLRELNKRVIGMGTRKSTSRLLASSCDEFIFYDSLLRRERPDENQESDPANETTESLDREDAFSLMVNTIKGLHKENPAAIRGGVIKQLMLRKHPTFDESDYNYDGFTAFLRAAQQHGLISLVPNKVGGGFMVDLYQGELDQVTITGDDNNTPQLSEAAQPLLNALQQMQLRPTTKLIRHTVLHEFVDHITERVRNNKYAKQACCLKRATSAVTTKLDHNE